MRPLRAILSRLGALFHRTRGERELRDEIESHLQMHIDENVRCGMSAGEARREALLKLGGIEPVKEAYRDRRGVPAIETLLQDLQYAIRTLRKQPGFAAVVILTLALGVGANTAMFSLIDAVLLKMLPVSHPEQLFFVTTNATQMGNIRVSRSILNRDLEQMQKRAARVAGLGAYATASTLNVAVDGRAELASGHFVSGAYFATLGVQPLIGRTILPRDDRADGRVALVSYGFFTRCLGADPNRLGQTIRVNNVPFTLIGVTPPEFYGLSNDTQADVVLAAATLPQVGAAHMSSEEPKPDGVIGTVFARLKAGVTTSDAAAELGAILRQTEREASAGASNQEQLGSIEKLSIELKPAGQGLSQVRNRFSKPLQVLMVVVGLVMLIACANIANLLLAKSSVRQREIAIRLSLGSSRRRLIRQLLTESLLLSIVGGLFGMVFAVWARSAIIYLATTHAGSPAIPAEWNLRVLAFTATVSILNAFVFGMAPALRATRIDLASMLKGERKNTRARRMSLGRILVVGQVAVSLVLLIGAALFLDTFRNLDLVDLGFQRKNLLMVALDPTLAGYSGAKVVQVFRDVMERASALPGVSAVTLMRDRILTGQVSMTSLWVPGYTFRSGEDPSNLWVVSNAVGPRFFEISGMRLTAGRDFTDRDNAGAPKVAIISQSMAEHFFAGRNPIGRQIAWSRSEAPVQIVGVVRNMSYLGVRDQGQDVVFTPILQSETDSWNSATVLIRSNGDAGRIMTDVRNVIRAIDPNLPAYRMLTMDQQVESTLVQQRLLATLSAFFGLLALGLSAVGLYGVVSYGVAQRTSELGLRMALGASRSGLLSLVLGETARMAAIGTATGIAIALVAGRLIRGMLYGVTPTDSLSLSGGVILLSTVVLLAGFLPARRASRVDPMVTLRYE